MWLNLSIILAMVCRALTVTANACEDRCPLSGTRPIELKIMVEVHYPTATSTAPRDAYVPAGSYHHHFLLVLVFGLALVFLHLVQPSLPQPIEDVPRSATRVVPGHRLPVSESSMDAPAEPHAVPLAQRTSSSTPAQYYRSRLAVAQALEPVDHSGTREDRRCMWPAGPVTHTNGIRGLSSLVVQTAGLEPCGSHTPKNWQDPDAENLGLTLSPRRARPWLYPSIEGVLAQTGEDFSSRLHNQPPSDSDQPSATERIPSSPLTKTLVGWNLTKVVTRLLILAVGVGGEDLPGPEHDVQWLGRLFSAAMFYAPRGSRATKKAIRSALEHMFEIAEPIAVIVLYFAGHGNDNNAFELYDGETIDEATLFQWIDELRTITGKHLPVFLAFDFCRENKHVPPVSTDQLDQVYVIWACIPGQRSYDVKLDDDLPYSNLLQAVCLALNEIQSRKTASSYCFMGRIFSWISRIMRIHRAIICGLAKCDASWNDCRCDSCGNGGLCIHPNHPDGPPPIQNPVGWFSELGNDIDTERVLHAIQPILDCLAEPLQRIAANIGNNKWYRKFVGKDTMPASSSSSEGLFQPVDCSVSRGSSAALASAPAPSSSLHGLN